MVSALKFNNRHDNRMTLETVMKKFVGESKRQYIYDENIVRKPFVDKSVQNLAVNSIIEGYFPKENLVKAMAVKRLNKTLCIIISMLIAVAVVSYYFVLSCEIKLNDLNRQTVILNNENEELQNKLDTLKSFNNVDKTLQKNNMLQRAGQVIETPEIIVDTDSIIKKRTKNKVFNYAIGF